VRLERLDELKSPMTSPGVELATFRLEHFIIGVVGEGGVQSGPLDTAATNGPIVPVPGDYDDG
jgi:hypothetical protein